MRISTGQQYERLRDGILNNQVRLAELQGQLSSGKRIQRPSDDPFAMAAAMALRAARSLAEQHKHNADAARANMALAENAVGEMGELMKRANTLAINGANGAATQEGRQAMAAEISRLQEQLVALGNTKDASGAYMFAGHLTKTTPFVVNASPPPPLQYQGDNGQRILDVGPGTAAAANVLVDTQVVAAYEALEDTKTRLLAGDTSGLSGVSLQLIQDSSASLRTARGDIGVLAKKFEDASRLAVRRYDDFTSLISEREDADIAEVAVQLSAAQVSYQAALAAFTATHQSSLLDYIRG